MLFPGLATMVEHKLLELKDLIFTMSMALSITSCDHF